MEEIFFFPLFFCLCRVFMKEMFCFPLIFLHVSQWYEGNFQFSSFVSFCHFGMKESLFSSFLLSLRGYEGNSLYSSFFCFCHGGNEGIFFVFFLFSAFVTLVMKEIFCCPSFCFFLTGMKETRHPQNTHTHTHTHPDIHPTSPCFPSYPNTTTTPSITHNTQYHHCDTCHPSRMSIFPSTALGQLATVLLYPLRAQSHSSSPFRRCTLRFADCNSRPDERILCFLYIVLVRGIVSSACDWLGGWVGGWLCGLFFCCIHNLISFWGN